MRSCLLTPAEAYDPMMMDYSADNRPPIATRAGLHELIEHLRSARRFAFDTEFVSEGTFEPILSLIQVATRDRLVTVDPIALGGVGEFWDLVTDPGVEVVMHAAGEDLRICRIQSGRLPERVVDVQVAAGLVGHSYPMSLNNLVRQELGVTLPGGETRTDWRQRPLSEAQLRYALDDVRHLLDLADRIHARLDAWGRLAWAEAEYREKVAQIEARAEAGEDRWRRLPGLNQLNRRGLEIARRLAGWRLGVARAQDRPVRQVMRDDLLVAIARRAPATKKDLEALRDFQRGHLLSRARDILDVIAEATLVPDDELPRHGDRHEEGPGLSMVINLLNATLNQACTEQNVAAPLVGTSGDLKELVRWHVAGRPAEHPADLARGWRAEVCGQVLADVLSGRRTLRIVDPTAEVPVALDPIEPTEPTT